MASKPFDVVLYTDGACSGNPGPGGWAYILIHPASDKRKYLAGGVPNTTNNRMELSAVIEGLKAVKTDQRWRVVVKSDSEYVVRGINEWLPGWIAKDWRRGSGRKTSPVKNVDLWQELHALVQTLDVTFEHVRGHSGDPLNEACDQLAVGAIERLRSGQD